MDSSPERNGEDSDGLSDKELDKYVSEQADAVKQAPVRIRSVKEEVQEMR